MIGIKFLFVAAEESENFVARVRSCGVDNADNAQLSS